MPTNGTMGGWRYTISDDGNSINWLDGPGAKPQGNSTTPQGQPANAATDPNAAGDAAQFGTTAAPAGATGGPSATPGAGPPSGETGGANTGAYDPTAAQPNQPGKDDYGAPIGPSNAPGDQYQTMAGNNAATGNSYGLASQPQTMAGNSSGGATIPNYAPSKAGIWGGTPAADGPSASKIANDAFQKSLDAQKPPMPGGSSTISGGSVPDVNAMAKPYGGGPPAAPTIGATPMPTTLMDKYKSFISDPSGGMNNPIFKSMMDSGLQAAGRQSAGGGFNGSGNILTALQDRGTGIAGQYLPQMAQMYGQGAQTEADRWRQENQGNVQTGQLGLNTWTAGANDQLNRASANYGAGSDAAARFQALQAQQQIVPTMQSMLARGGY